MCLAHRLSISAHKQYLSDLLYMYIQKEDKMYTNSHFVCSRTEQHSEIGEFYHNIIWFYIHHYTYYMYIVYVCMHKGRAYETSTEGAFYAYTRRNKFVE